MRLFSLLVYGFICVAFSWVPSKIISSDDEGQHHQSLGGKGIPKSPKSPKAGEKHKKHDDKKSSDEEEDEGKKKDEPPKKKINIGGDGITITYYNVGQGNCVLMQNHEKKQAVLVDCGSTESEGIVRANNEKPSIDKKLIQESIDVKLKAVAPKDIVIIVTHMDRDHYNWIRGIEGIDPKEAKFIISSSKSLKLFHHGGEQQGIKDDLLTEVIEKHGTNLFQVDTPEKLTEAIKECGLGSWIKPLTAASGAMAEKAGVGAPAKSKNADSVVIKAHSGECSALLTGDANEASAEAIEEEKKEDDLKTTVLLAPHHGSITHGSNNHEWVKNTSPKAVIVSAGHHLSYAHPQCEVLGRYWNYGSLLEGKNTELTCFQEKEYVDFIAQLAKKGPVVTKAIYNTYDQGNITVKLNTADSGADVFTIDSAKNGHMLKASCKAGV
jgi:beta-lactamase superfamily II metal-dependent hydrolase